MEETNVWLRIEDIDFGANLVYGRVLGQEGSTKIQLLCWNTEVLEKVFRKYKEGSDLVNCRIFAGTLKEVYEQLSDTELDSRSDTKVALYTAEHGSPEREWSIERMEQLKKERKEEGLNRAVDSLVKYYHYLKDTGQI